jgi:hypothetical protein
MDQEVPEEREYRLMNSQTLTLSQTISVQEMKVQKKGKTDEGI